MHAAAMNTSSTRIFNIRMGPLAIVGLLALPVLELAAFIAMAGWIGLLPAVGLSTLTSILGVVILRRQGRSFIERLNGRRTAKRPVGDGTMLGLAGLMLALPGFITDAAGLLLLAAPVRHLVRVKLGLPTVPTGPQPKRRRDEVIELERGEWKSID